MFLLSECAIFTCECFFKAPLKSGFRVDNLPIGINLIDLSKGQNINSVGL